MFNFIERQWTQSKVAPDIRRYIKDTRQPDYTVSDRKPGDVFFWIEDGQVTHVNMVATDTSFKVHSVVTSTDKHQPDGNGVRKSRMSGDTRHSLVFRYRDEGVALAAALLAESWAMDSSVTNRVGYSDYNIAGAPARQFGLAFGTCHFGKGAQARLLKYGRNNLTPSNVTCVEMVTLAYQLVVHDESHGGFIKLDAKHSLPQTLLKYIIDSSWSGFYWNKAGQRRGRM